MRVFKSSQGRLILVKPCYTSTCKYMRVFKYLEYHYNIWACLYNDIVICLCSEQLLRLSYYIHPGHGKTFLVSHRDQTWVLPNLSRHLPLDQSADWIENYFWHTIMKWFMRCNVKGWITFDYYALPLNEWNVYSL